MKMDEEEDDRPFFFPNPDGEFVCVWSVIQKRNNTSLVHHSARSCFIRTWQIYSSGDNGLGFEPENKWIAGLVFIFKGLRPGYIDNNMKIADERFFIRGSTRCFGINNQNYKNNYSSYCISAFHKRHLLESEFVFLFSLLFWSKLVLFEL